MTTRAEFRKAVGRDLGRRFYLTGAVASGSTTDELVVTTMNAYEAEWDGATLRINGEEVLVRGTAPGRIFLDVALSNGAPTAGAAFEMVKGFTVQDLDDAIDYAFRASYPAIFDPIDDQGVSIVEVSGQELYVLPASWQVVTHVMREVKGTASPVLYDPYLEGFDWEIIQTTAGLTYRSRRVTETGVKLWFHGEATAALGAADIDTSRVPLDIVKYGALYWLYQKGTNPDELAINATFDKEEDDAEKDWGRSKVQLGMARESQRKVKRPRVGVVNTGNTQWFG